MGLVVFEVRWYRWGRIGVVVDSVFFLGLGELIIIGLFFIVIVSEGDIVRLLCVVVGENVNIRWFR